MLVFIAPFREPRATSFFVSLCFSPYTLDTDTMSATETSTAPITAENILRLFPDIDTRGEALEGHDEEQIRLMDEVCIVTDENDLPIGTASKKLCKSPPFLAQIKQVKGQRERSADQDAAQATL